MFEMINTSVSKVFTDPAYAGRGFVQTVEHSGAKPVVKPTSNATPKAKAPKRWGGISALL